MKRQTHSIPSFFIDALTGTPETDCRELLRSVEIRSNAADIFLWLKQLRVAPYSYDLLDNGGRKSPGYVIENLPPLRLNTHFLLAFHICGFEENSHIVCRFCEPINPPVNRYMKDLYLEYRITEHGGKSRLWCKLKGHFHRDISSRGFYFIYSVANWIMMTRQLKNIRRLSEQLASGKVETMSCDYKSYYIKSGLHWWIFCRRHNCKGLIA